jgi:hypothetical protein
MEEEMPNLFLQIIGMAHLLMAGHAVFPEDHDDVLLETMREDCSSRLGRCRVFDVCTSVNVTTPAWFGGYQD